MRASCSASTTEHTTPPATQDFTRRLGYRFRNGRLLEQALTHRSHAFENGSPETHNENLEFLGDAVLGTVVADFLYRNYPSEDEGFLSRIKSLAVSRTTLARIGRRIGIGDAARIGVGEERSGARCRDSLLADMLEAVIGACFLDGGFLRAAALIVSLVEEEVLAIVDGRVHGSARSELQEFLQKSSGQTPEYRLLSEQGPDNDKVFTMEVLIENRVCGTGTGRTKKDAAQEAALLALASLGQSGKPQQGGQPSGPEKQSGKGIS
jgi:ribonuclease-3